MAFGQVEKLLEDNSIACVDTACLNDDYCILGSCKTIIIVSGKHHIFLKLLEMLASHHHQHNSFVLYPDICW